MIKLLTNISVPQSPAAEELDRGRRDALGWLDSLLKGGIVIPRRNQPDGEKRRALSLLLTGPPGTGKTTLALELCCKAAFHDSATEVMEQPRCLYVTSESTRAGLQQQVASYGWTQDGARIDLFEPDGRGDRPGVEVAETRDFQTYLQKGRSLFEAIVRGLGFIVSPSGEAAEEAGSAAGAVAAGKAAGKLIAKEAPNILVIDSLNTVPSEDRANLFKAFDELRESEQLDLVVLILDADEGGGDTDFWAFATDMIVRLDRDVCEGYMIRTIEVVKARYQEHVWGKHQLKIYPGSGEDGNMDHHPYAATGGIFVFPSIHYHLSSVKHTTQLPHFFTAREPMATPIDTLNEALSGGFPRGRCVGILGRRGGYKSHLGYAHILNRLESGPTEVGLVVSLRDNPEMAQSTMIRIARNEIGLKDGERAFTEWLKAGRLDIMYFVPGYITPEEFFHRVYVAVRTIHKRQPEAAVTLMFNSLDQLGARFPLCTREPIFIPGLVEMLCGEDVTSIFIGVPDEGGQPEEQYGLLPMADTLLSVSRTRDGDVRLTLDRLPRGRPSGKYGRLELKMNGLVWEPR